VLLCPFGPLHADRTDHQARGPAAVPQREGLAMTAGPAWSRRAAIAFTVLGCSPSLLPWACNESTPNGGTPSRPIFNGSWLGPNILTKIVPGRDIGRWATLHEILIAL
jgi:hypothetical protein